MTKSTTGVSSRYTLLAVDEVRTHFCSFYRGGGTIHAMREFTRCVITDFQNSHSRAHRRFRKKRNVPPPKKKDTRFYLRKNTAGYFPPYKYSIYGKHLFQIRKRLVAFFYFIDYRRRFAGGYNHSVRVF